MSFRDSVELTDPKAMRALAHPTRLAIFHALVDGPSTATRCAEVVGESPSSCSYHLRMLAEQGFVEETESRDGRERAWRLVRRGWRTRAGATASDEFAAASNVLRDSTIEQSDAAIDAFRANQKAFPPEWQEAAAFMHSIVYTTPEELEEIAEKILDVLTPYAERAGTDDKPDGARKVITAFRAVPYGDAP